MFKRIKEIDVGKEGIDLANVRKIAVFSIIVLFTVFFISPSFGNSQFYSVVQSIFNTHRVKVSYDQMSLMKESEDSEVFTISVPSRRNNFEMNMLLGFFAAGKAILKCNEPVEKVTVIVSVEYKGVEKIFATASRSDILKFVKGDLQSAKFVRKINFN